MRKREQAETVSQVIELLEVTMDSKSIMKGRLRLFCPLMGSYWKALSGLVKRELCYYCVAPVEM